METFEVLKLIKAMQDLTQQPSYVVKNFDIDTGAFDVYYNDGALKNDDWYGPINMDLDMMRPEEEEPIRMQIAKRVLSYVQTQQLVECPMEATKLALSQMLGVEQQFSAMDIVKHEEAMRRNGDVLSRRLKMGLYRKLQFALGMIRKPRINLFSGNL